MPWRQSVLNAVGPGLFAGVTAGDWFRILRENHFAVDFRYWARAVGITLGCVPNSLWRWLERICYEARVRQTEIEPPLFVLGAWRSGTTHLHNLIAQDNRFAFPNFHEWGYPV